MAQVIAVTGATGGIGGRVARRLASVAPETPTRLLCRDPSRLPEVEGAVVAPPAAYGDPDGMRRAIGPADTLLLVSARESADRVGEHRSAVDAAVAAGVERVVYLSFVGAAPDATFTFARDHWHTEQHIRASGLRWTFLRDSFYLAALPGMTGSDGVMRGPGGEGRVAAVAHDDVAAVATAVLLDDTAHDGETYDVTGPEAITLAEAASVLADFTGREITYVPETRDEAYASRAHYGVPAWEMAGWVTSYEAIATGEMDVVSAVVPRLTGRPARTLATFLKENPESVSHLTTKG